jgi:hypothetical protein
MAHRDLIILKIIVRKEGGLERLSEEKENSANMNDKGENTK